MNYQEAYQTLQLTGQPSEEEIKKQFRKLAAQYHPDINKTPEAETKSKQISEAYEFLKKYKSSEEFPVVDFSVNIQDLFHNFQTMGFGHGFSQVKSKPRHPPVHLHLTLTFAESILGAIKKITLTRQIPCEDCAGNGEITGLTNCVSCEGKGVTVKKSSKQEIRSTCQLCRGLGKQHMDCKSCQGAGTINSSTEQEIKLPAGVPNNSTLRLPGAGNFVPEFRSFEEAILRVTVTPDPQLKLIDGRVQLELKISLLQALTGDSIEVPTVLGPRTITIPPQAKHSDTVTIPNCGVGQVNPQIVKLQVEYPVQLDNLISLLSDSKE